MLLVQSGGLKGTVLGLTVGREQTARWDVMRTQTSGLSVAQGDLKGKGIQRPACQLQSTWVRSKVKATRHSGAPSLSVF